MGGALENVTEQDIAGVPPCNAHVTFLLPPNSYISMGVQKSNNVFYLFYHLGGVRGAKRVVNG